LFAQILVSSNICILTSSSDPLSVRAFKAEFFRALGSPVRIGLLQLLREGEQTVGALQAALGLDSSGTSQHLAALRKQGLVATRRDGTSVYYRVRDPRVIELLELARAVLTARLEEDRALLHARAPGDAAADGSTTDRT
jgi:DNA-binding transcriptional ArsR family regulator